MVAGLEKRRNVTGAFMLRVLIITESRLAVREVPVT